MQPFSSTGHESGPFPPPPDLDFPALIEPVARALCGKPNAAQTTKTELRFGSNGSLSVRIGGDKCGTWYDHEQSCGGGTLDLVCHVKGMAKGAAAIWIGDNFSPGYSSQNQQPKASHAGAGQKKSRIVATYAYEDECGAPVFEVVRFEPKDFRQRRPKPEGGHEWSVKGLRSLPYRLPEFLEGIGREAFIFIVEGEKDVDRLRTFGLFATCNAGGAGKWSADHAQWLKDAHVVILPDNDMAGSDHAQQVARSLAGIAASIRILSLPGLPEKGDVSDWFNIAGNGDALQALARDTPLWRERHAPKLPVILYGDEDNQPQLSWLVKGLFVNGGLSAVYAPPGAGKSFFVLDLALHIAHGRSWFGRDVEAGGVVYVTGEGASGMLLRMKAWRNAKEGAARAPFALIPTSINLYDSDEGATTLVDDVKILANDMKGGVKLVIFDTLSRMIGNGDEDRAADMNRIIQRAERIQWATGAHVLIVHHTGKDETRGARGSNALIGAVETLIKLEKYESGLIKASLEKLKDGGAVAPLTFRLAPAVATGTTQAPVGGPEDETVGVSSCVVMPTDSAAHKERKTAHLSDSDKIAIGALREALLDEGRASPGGEVPASVKVVDIEVWRRIAYAKGVSEADTPEARRQAFKRIRDRLQARHVIGVWESLVWIAE